ncbi:hypothetical protein PV08_09183 [Exophiala spinifera]|uniref:Uncharacterized protein n=1 Tax=Exophiala spinifera TaxID=91928 RepID=A0A0D2AZN4_9EURO|nr:uncharacterized protein PV08_09183 [Exophiala spinifera]KIW11910.1 hypothetical protein PV08_09183 [Exophiala spinifera]
MATMALSTRRSVSDRPRGSSQEFSESQEDLVLFRGFRTVNGPERQPSVPPSTQRAQQDEGFARFLKKHSSPTHQRVTAGGRIVPMEHRPRPPSFTLAQSKQIKEAEPANGVDGHVEHSDDAAKKEPKELRTHFKPSAEGAEGQFMQPPLPVLDNRNMMSGPFINNMITTADTFAVDAHRLQTPFYNGIMATPTFPNMYDPFGFAPGQMYPAATMPHNAPLTGFGGNIEPQYQMPLLPAPDATCVPATDALSKDQRPQSTPEDLHSRNMLQEAINRFDDLDQQLKSLDRQRAMSERDPQVVSQRMAIVGLRADAKASMNYWTSVVENKLKALGRKCAEADGTAHTFNVEAADYVPLNAGNQAISNTYSNYRPAPGLKAPPKRGHRRIPIVAPRKDSSGNSKSNQGTETVFVEVDEWGARIGDPPDDIQLEQSKMLLELDRELSISPNNSCNSSGSGSGTGLSAAVTSKSSPDKNNLGQVIPEQKDSTRCGNSEWLPTKTEDAPSTVEAFYEVQLDAMRLPVGFTTTVRLPDGSTSVIAGQGLRRPPSGKMDDFERGYWTKKPELSSNMAANFVNITADAGAGQIDRDNRKENAMVDTGSGFPQGGPSHWAIPQSAVARGFKPPRFGRNAYTSVTGASTSSDTALSSIPTITSPVRLSRDKAGWSASEFPKTARESPYDATNIKGYSSVSVQNIHAMVRLPNTVGESTDMQRRSAVSLLSAAGKARSPESGRIPTGPRNRFHNNPQGRNGGGVMLPAENIFRPQAAKHENM